jgi:uncharacterized protein (DUF697 family)
MPRTSRDLADQVRALRRIAKTIRDGGRPCNLDASWIEAAAEALGQVAVEKFNAEKR